MKKMLFISNISKRITNFSIPSIFAAQSLGYEFHMAANYSGFNDDPSKYNVTIHHIDIVRNPFDLRNIKAYKQMLALTKKEKFDIIHCNTPIGGLLGRLCGKRAKIPKIIYTAHGFHFYKGAPLINRTIYKWAEIWLARYTDVIITINQEDYQAAKKFKLRNNGKVYYVPGVGVDTSLVKKAKPKREELLGSIGASKDSVILISVGELNNNKNNKVIIKALGKMNNPKIHYILCGLGNKKNDLFNQAKNYGLVKNVHFLGYRNDIPELLKSCDIFVLTSYREGLSRSLMEAMAAGLPCIVSKIRGNVDLIKEGKGGFLRKPNDIDGLANAINLLASDKTLRESMGGYNQKIIGDYDIENVKKKMIRIYYNELLKE